MKTTHLQTKKQNERSGFTLLELLVVLAIIAVLAAASLVVFRETTEESKSIIDFSNLRTLNRMSEIYRDNWPEVNIDAYDSDEMMEALIPGYIKKAVVPLGKDAEFIWFGETEKKWILAEVSEEGQVEIIYTSIDCFSQTNIYGTLFADRIYGYNGAGGTDLIIPPTITSIEQSAFFYGYASNTWEPLTSVILPDTLLKISGNAFHSNQLTSIVIPDSVTYLGANSFYGNKLTQIEFGSGLSEIRGGAFATNQLTEITLPPTIQKIGSGAFQSNTITRIVIGDNVAIETTASMGTYGKAFNLFYESEGRAAGTYVYENGAWKK